MDLLNPTSTAWQLPVPCSCIPLFWFFIGSAQKPREYGECQVLQLDRYWSLDVWLYFLKCFTVDSLNPMSWFRLFYLCFHPRYIFQVHCLHHIVERMLQKTGVFVILVKQPKYKGDVASFLSPPCWFSTLCFITASVSLFIHWLSRSNSLIFVAIARV